MPASRDSADVLGLRAPPAIWSWKTGVFMAEAMGLRTGIDLDALCGIRELIEANLPDARLSGAIAKAGVPKGYAPATQFAVAAE